MHGFFRNMGVIQWPMYVATFFMVVQIGRAARQVRLPAESRSAMTTHTILIWGFLNLLLGVLGTVVGLSLAGQAVERIGRVSAPLVAGGIKVALSTSIFGLLLLIIAVLCWLVLQLWQGRTPEARSS